MIDPHEFSKKQFELAAEFGKPGGETCIFGERDGGCEHEQFSRLSQRG